MLAGARKKVNCVMTRRVTEWRGCFRRGKGKLLWGGDTEARLNDDIRMRYVRSFSRRKQQVTHLRGEKEHKEHNVCEGRFVWLPLN